MMKRLSFLILFLSAQFFWANISLPYLFSDNMVLQRDAEIPVWGFAEAGEKVKVSFKNQNISTTADAAGNWMIKLKPEKFGGPFTLKIEGNNSIELQNILIGDVWLCSGQSNMEWPLSASDGYQNELTQKNFPQIRQIKVQKSVNTIPQKNIEKTAWKVADASTIGEFSGVAYYFAKKIYAERGVPIGIINSSWGGTNIETWIPRDGFENSPHFKEMISKMPKVTVEEHLHASMLERAKNIEEKTHSKISDFNARNFLSNDFNDQNSAEIDQPALWETQGYNSLDGVVWLRKIFVLSSDDLKNDAQLFLSKIDDQDETYVNGTLVGKTEGYDVLRKYSVPKNLLKEGKNTLVVRVNDTGGGGGIYGDKNDLKIITSKQTISFAGNWKIAVEKIQQNLNENDYPSLVYNAMVAPLVSIKLKGILWYQGESNADRAAEYRISLPLLINSWREKFGKDLPFYFVQLATFETAGKDSNEGSSWAELREAQTSALTVKNTGMVVTTDVGNPKNIHPTNKKAVGERLANLALKNGKYSPVFKDFKVTGNTATVNFNTKKKLKTNDGGNVVRGLEIAGNDGVFYPATGKIMNNKLVVSSEKVAKPVAARMGWKGDASENNLFTEDGLPVSPFRTDKFPLKTKDVHYQIIFK